MKKHLLMFGILLLSIGVAYGQFEQVINSFDEAPADTNYWAWFNPTNQASDTAAHFQASDNANPDSSFVHVSYVTSPVMFGAGAMKLEYSAQNIEGWGGYAKLEHWNPDSNAVYDFSNYDSISFCYYNDVKQSLTGRVELRFNLHDVSNSENGNKTYSVLECEYYYSFHHVLDDEPGWHEIKMPLQADPNYWNGEGFNLTGWSGINGNATLDPDKIKGFSIEFSISGSGEGDRSYGTIILDHLTLKGLKAIPFVFFNGRNVPSRLSSFTWGQSTLDVEESAGATAGTNALKWVQGDEWGNGWTGAGFNIDPPYNMIATWSTDSLKFKLKAETGTGKIRMQFEDGTAKVGKDFDPIADGEWHDYTFKLNEMDYQDGTSNFDSSSVSVFQFMGVGTGIAGKTIYLDDIWTGNPEFDWIAPEEVTGVDGVPAEHYNLIIWEDVPGETEEFYDVYASEETISDINAPEVELIAAGVPENTQTAIHYIYYPLLDQNVTYYYAVTCKDANGNVGLPGVSSAVTNTAKGIATISLSPPSNFAADGDLADWEASGIMPFVLKPTTNHIPAGSITDDADLTATVYLAVDDDNLYIAADVVDNVYNYGTGNWWDQDAFQIFIGLYDWRGSKHQSLERGSEPDYIMYMVEERLQHDNGGYVIYTPDDDNYYFEGFNPDYVAEAKIPLDSIAFGDDVRFHPERGMRIPIDLYFHDNDGDWDGNLGFSPYSTDHQWQTPTEWAHTWIGDTTHTVGIDEHDITTVANVYSLSQNYPNPFNPTTMINYSLAKSGLVRIDIYNVLGQKVETLVDKKKSAGNHSIIWNGKNMSSGVYFYRIQAGDFNRTKKMLLVK